MYSLPFVFISGRQLRSIEEEVLEHLTEQMKLHSQSLVSDLERASAELETEPQDLHDLSKYALLVQKLSKLYLLCMKNKNTLQKKELYPLCKGDAKKDLMKKAIP